MKTRYFKFDSCGAMREAADAVEFFSGSQNADANGFGWIDCCDPERIELEDIAVNFDLHRLSVDDCFDDASIPKIDIYPEYCTIIFNDVLPSPEGVALSECNYFLGEKFLLSVRRSASEEHYPIGKTVERLKRYGMAGGSVMLFHALLDGSVDRAFPAIEETTERIAEIEDNVIAGTAQLDAAELSGIRHSLLALRKSLNYERELMSRIRRRESLLFAEAVLPYFGDINDHLASHLDLTESGREMVGNLVQMNLTLSSNSMAEASNRMNRSVSRLTFITTIFMPLTLLAGIGGMSEWTMMTGPDNWTLSYPLMLLGMAGIAALTAGILHWLDKYRSGL